MVALSQEYDIETYDLGNGFTMLRYWLEREAVTEGPGARASEATGSTARRVKELSFFFPASQRGGQS